MARIRSIKPEWLEDEKLVAAGLNARFLSVALITLADDWGNGRACPKLLAGRTQMPIRALRAAFDALVEACFVLAYEVDGQRYYHIRNWDKHQRIPRPQAPRVPRPDDVGSTEHRQTRDSVATGITQKIAIPVACLSIRRQSLSAAPNDSGALGSKTHAERMPGSGSGSGPGKGEGSQTRAREPDQPSAAPDLGFLASLDAVLVASGSRPLAETAADLDRQLAALPAADTSQQSGPRAAPERVATTHRCPVERLPAPEADTPATTLAAPVRERPAMAPVSTPRFGRVEAIGVYARSWEAEPSRGAFMRAGVAHEHFERFAACCAEQGRCEGLDPRAVAERFCAWFFAQDWAAKCGFSPTKLVASFSADWARVKGHGLEAQPAHWLAPPVRKRGESDDDFEVRRKRHMNRSVERQMRGESYWCFRTQRVVEPTPKAAGA